MSPTCVVEVRVTGALRVSGFRCVPIHSPVDRRPVPDTGFRRAGSYGLDGCPPSFPVPGRNRKIP